MTASEAHHLLVDAIHPLEPVLIEPQTGRDAWFVELGDGSAFDIEYDGRCHRFVICVSICEVPDQARLQIYEALLQYNFLWPQSGGLRMAIDGTPGQVVMLLDLPLTSLESSRLALALENMADIQRSWREIIPLAGLASTPASQGAPPGAAQLV